MALYGLDEAFAGRLEVRNRDVAAHFGVTSAAVSIALGKARKRWQKHRSLRELTEVCRSILNAAGGAAPIGKMADELTSRWPHERRGSQGMRRASAAALVKIVCELERDDPEGMRILRLRDDVPWVLSREALAPTVRRLGQAADALAAHDILASPGEAWRRLGEVVEDTPLSPLSSSPSSPPPRARTPLARPGSSSTPAAWTPPAPSS